MQTYETNPKGVDAEYGFSKGQHVVEYIAKNEFGDVAKCRYRVEVIGKFDIFDERGLWYIFLSRLLISNQD